MSFQLHNSTHSESTLHLEPVRSPGAATSSSASSVSLPQDSELAAIEDPMKIIEWYCCHCVQYYGPPLIRYDCLRCKHMMCPYCVKKRQGDLLNDNNSPTESTWYSYSDYDEYGNIRRLPARYLYEGQYKTFGLLTNNGPHNNTAKPRLPSLQIDTTTSASRQLSNGSDKSYQTELQARRCSSSNRGDTN